MSDMVIKVDGRERIAQITTAPRGSFYLIEECLPIYPIAIAYCEPLASEADYGNIIYCPIGGSNNKGYCCCERCEIYNHVEPYIFKQAVEHAMNSDAFESEIEAIDYLVEDFEIHGTPILKRTREWITERLAELSKENNGKEN